MSDLNPFIWPTDSEVGEDISLNNQKGPRRRQIRHLMKVKQTAQSRHLRILSSKISKSLIRSQQEISPSACLQKRGKNQFRCTDIQ